MSVINKMLQDLDRRNAGAMEAEAPARPVKPPAGAERHGNEWFWRIIAVLVLVSLGWVGWVAYQLQPRTIATEQALRAALQPRSGAIAAAQAKALPVVAPAVPVVAPEPVVAMAPGPVVAPVVVPAAEAKPVAEPAETFKLARAIETPIKPQAAPKSVPVKAQAAKPAPTKSPEPNTAAPAQARGTVDKRERAKPASEAGEGQFQRAALLLKQGRVSEAEHELQAALQVNPAHLGARQAYVSLLLEQQRIDAALRALQEAVALNPGHPAFSLMLARIHAEQHNYAAALEVMDKAGGISESADFQSLRGTVLLRLGRNAEAVTAYQKAVQAAPQPGETWTGFGISLEAVGRRADAAQAYRRALGAGALPRELREYAETRVRALE